MINNSVTSDKHNSTFIRSLLFLFQWWNQTFPAWNIYIKTVTWPFSLSVYVICEPFFPTNSLNKINHG